MRDDTRERCTGPRWDEASRVLAAEPATGGDESFEPLDARTRDAILARVLAHRRTTAAASPSRPLAPVRRLMRYLPLAVGLAAAASLAIVLRPSPAVGPLALDMGLTRAVERGPSMTSAERPVLSLRNEPGWKVRLPAGAETEGLQLYVVARTAGNAPLLLDAQVERLHTALRVNGEIRDLGLRPGEVTLYFVVGPEGAREGALAAAEAVRAGDAPSEVWAVERQDIRIAE